MLKGATATLGHSAALTTFLAQRRPSIAKGPDNACTMAPLGPDLKDETTLLLDESHFVTNINLLQEAGRVRSYQCAPPVPGKALCREGGHS